MKTPWHLWTIGPLALIWNAGGAYDYLMTVSRNAGYLDMFTPAQRDYIDAMPGWAVSFWALGVWGAVLGSLLLLLRRRQAFWAYVVSLLGLAGTSLYTYVLAAGPMPDTEGLGTKLFTAAIVVVALLLTYYARRMIAAQVLR